MSSIVAAATAMESSPIVTVNLWLDWPVTSVPFVGLPGRTMQWIFDKRQAFGEAASHLSLVSSGAESIVAKSNRELIDLAVGEMRHALVAARAATSCPRSGSQGKARHLLARARAAAAAAHGHTCKGPVSCRRLDRYRPACNDRERGRERSPRRGGGSRARRSPGDSARRAGLKPCPTELSRSRSDQRCQGISRARRRSAIRASCEPSLAKPPHHQAG